MVLKFSIQGFSTSLLYTFYLLFKDAEMSSQTVFSRKYMEVRRNIFSRIHLHFMTRDTMKLYCSSWALGAPNIAEL